MDTPALVLASASPRRRRLVSWLGVPVRLAAADTPEDTTVPLPPNELACSLAAEKARAVGNGGGQTVLAFDTIVVHDGRVLGKPRDRADAKRMLDELAGGPHEVVTGVAILPPGTDVPDTFAVVTLVTMRTPPPAAVEAWLAGDEVLGCAGAYNIEHHLASVADDECFHNVAGMPLCHVYRELASGRAGVVPEGLVPPVAACDAALGRRCLLGPTICGLLP
jgi:septum formation protein